MKNTEYFYNAFQAHRAGMREIQEEKAHSLKNLEPFRDSGNYSKLADEIEEKASAKIEALKQKTGGAFNEALEAMQERLDRVEPMQAPTQEQLSTLQALSMLDKLTPEQIDEAAKKLDGCPVAISILNRMALSSGYPSHQVAVTSKAQHQESLDALRRFARIVLEMPAVDNREKYVLSPLHHPDAYPAESNRIAWLTHDRDFENAASCVEWASNTDDLSGFTKSVD